MTLIWPQFGLRFGREAAGRAPKSSLFLTCCVGFSSLRLLLTDCIVRTASRIAPPLIKTGRGWN